MTQSKVFAVLLISNLFACSGEHIYENNREQVSTSGVTIGPEITKTGQQESREELLVITKESPGGKPEIRRVVDPVPTPKTEIVTLTEEEQKAVRQFSIENQETDITQINKEAIENNLLAEGDILLTEEQKKIIEESEGASLTAKANPNYITLWTGGVVPFEYDPEIEKATTGRNRTPVKNYIVEAMDQISKTTGIIFRPAEKSDKNVVLFIRGEGCYSMIGMITSYRAQTISIGPGCEVVGIVQHEIYHALGLFHEQSSGDRDNYIDVNLDVATGKYNFTKIPQNRMRNLGIEYDFNSIMHYGSCYFSKYPAQCNSKNLENAPLKRKVAASNGSKYIYANRQYLSDTDIKAIKVLYQDELEKVKEGNETNPKPALTNLNVATLSEKSNFYLSTKWQGVGKVLSANPDGSVSLQTNNGSEASEWSFKKSSNDITELFRSGSLTDYFFIKNTFHGSAMCLRTERYKLSMQPCSLDDPKQLWMLTFDESDKSFYNIRTKFSKESNFCIDIVNDDLDNEPRVKYCENVTGQMWNLRPVEDGAELITSETMSCQTAVEYTGKTDYDYKGLCQYYLNDERGCKSRSPYCVWSD